MEIKNALKNKKILFFSPFFFSYEKSIKRKMEEMGATVYMFDERAVNAPFSRALLSVIPCLFTFKARKYFKKIVNHLADIPFDYVFIVKSDMIDKSTIKLFREFYPDAKLCLYLWDSIHNVKGISKKIPLYDFASSFDRHDCDNNDKLHFRPLFYDDTALPKRTAIKYDLCFCGTVHTDRYYIVKKIFGEAELSGYKTNSFLYLQAKFIFYFYKLFGKGFKKAKMSEFSFSKKPTNEIIEIENESKVVLDIQDPKQSGLTMRTIEMIGSKKKLVTTNKDIVNYDFYDDNNILIVDRNKPILDLGFFEKPYKELSDETYLKYSLQWWVLDVLGINIKE